MWLRSVLAVLLLTAVGGAQNWNGVPNQVYDSTHLNGLSAQVVTSSSANGITNQSLPGDTATYPNLQALGSGGWTVQYGSSCCGGSDSGTGSGAWGIASPSLSGGSMSLTNVYTGAAGNGLNSQMFTVLDCSILSGASCLSANNIKAEVHYYIPSSSATPQALEGPNLVLYDGTDQEYPSLQCNFATNHWNIWTSASWFDTSLSCTAAETTNVWHDLVANYTIDGVAHTLGYVSVTLDGSSIGTLGQSYSGEAFASSAALKAQVQLDGNEAGASTTAVNYDRYDVTVTTNSGTATPVLGPFAIANMTGNNANYKPSPTLSFGRQGIGTSSMAVPITISNCSNSTISACSGTGNLTVSAMAISGANASDFTLSGSCGTIASGADCEPTITFHPTASSGTDESATLTVTDNGTTGTQAMALTGTSATVTTLSACGTLSSGTNYQLTSDVSATGSCFIFTGSGSDLNLNGHTVTFCSAGGTTLVGGIFVNGYNESTLMVHNGTITEAAGKTCTGLTGTNGYGSAPFMVSSAGNASDGKGNGFWNLTLSTNEAPGNAIFEEGAGGTGNTTIMHDVNLVLNGTYNCPFNDVGCRSADQFYGVVEDQVQNEPAFNFYDIGQTGGTQGGLASLSPGSTVSYTLMSPGSTVATNSNGFAIQTWSTGTISHNLAVGSGPGGALLSARGGQLASIGGPLTGATITGNTFIATYLANNDEYAGCALGGAYGYQINTAGNGYDISNNAFSGNTFKAVAGPCDGIGFSDSGSTAGSGPNVINGDTDGCDINTGTYVSGVVCAGVRLDALQYTPAPDNAVVWDNSHIYGDTAAVYVLGTPARTFNQDTFGTGAHPIASPLFVDYDGGLNSGCGINTVNTLTFVDPTFTGVLNKTLNNLSTWATNNPTCTFGYLVKWTYTVTVEQASNSAPISGAAVTITPANSGTPCSTTTNASGVATCPLPDTDYQAVTGTYSTPSYNPMAIQITKSGCTTGSYSETITATTAETKKLSGC